MQQIKIKSITNLVCSLGLFVCYVRWRDLDPLPACPLTSNYSSVSQLMPLQLFPFSSINFFFCCFSNTLDMNFLAASAKRRMLHAAATRQSNNNNNNNNACTLAAFHRQWLSLSTCWLTALTRLSVCPSVAWLLLLLSCLIDLPTGWLIAWCADSGGSNHLFICN